MTAISRIISHDDDFPFPFPRRARTSDLERGLARASETLSRVSLTLIVLAAGCFGAYMLWGRYMYSPWTRDARIQADVVSIAPDVSGFIQEFRVKDNQVVRKGDVLFALDQERYKLAVATAEAAVECRRAAMEMQQRIANRRAQLTNLAASDEERENARFNAAAATAAYDQAVAELAIARLNLARTVVAAPVNGIVANLTLVNGQYAAAGAGVMAVIDGDSYRVAGYFEETKIPSLKLGQTRVGHADERAARARGTGRKHQPRHHRPRQSQGTGPARRGHADLRVGAARAAHPRANPYRQRPRGKS